LWKKSSSCRTTAIVQTRCGDGDTDSWRGSSVCVLLASV
jgi:hypothetical protein